MEELIITVGNCLENNWRRENLLRSKHVVEAEDHFAVSYTFVELNPETKIPKSIKLIYKIMK